MHSVGLTISQRRFTGRHASLPVPRQQGGISKEIQDDPFFPPRLIPLPQSKAAWLKQLLKQYIPFYRQSPQQTILRQLLEKLEHHIPQAKFLAIETPAPVPISQMTGESYQTHGPDQLLLDDELMRYTQTRLPSKGVGDLLLILDQIVHQLSSEDENHQLRYNGKTVVYENKSAGLKVENNSFRSRRQAKRIFKQLLALRHHAEYKALKRSGGEG